jgi:predicted ferric reductase
MRAGLDHIVYACSDLTQACVEFERRSGIRPVYGGLHSGGATQNASDRHVKFVVKELGDYTDHLRDTLHVGQVVMIEGPYGCFTFADSCPTQIWVAGGIGISPFLARMAFLANPARRPAQDIHLFHATADEDEGAFAKLTSDATAAGVHLHLLVDRRDGFLSGEKIRAAVPAWRDASLWFCGPVALGAMLRGDLSNAGMDVDARFHQELFALR